MISVSATDDNGTYIFQPGDVLRLKVFAKKDTENVVFEQYAEVTTATDTVTINLDKTDTKKFEPVNKPTDYWYEVELNPFTNPQTIIGYDGEGTKVLRLFPEGADIDEDEPTITPEDIPIVDSNLDLTSKRPIENMAVTRAIYRLEGAIRSNEGKATEKFNKVNTDVEKLNGEIAVERARIDTFLDLPDGSTTNDARLEDICAGADGVKYDSPGASVREQISLVTKELHSYLTTGKNLVDISKMNYGYRLNSNGEIDEHPSYAISDYIACTDYSGYFIASNYNGSACFYDEGKNYISGYDNILYNNERKIPDNAKYLRATWGDGEIETYMQNVTLIVSRKEITETPTFDEFGKRMSRAVDVEDKRLFVGEKVTNAGNKNQTISIGDGACRNVVSSPIAIGTNALASLIESTADNDAGKYSVAIGHQCMQRTTTGDHNTGIGWGCMADNTTGCGNTAVGEDALCHSVKGNSNTCIGNRAYQTGKGSRNTVIGATAMYEGSDKIPDGDANVSVGYGSGLAEGDGDNNTAIGTYAKHLNSDSRYSIAIGSMAKTTKSRQVVIGSTESGTPHPLETILNGDIIICGVDMVFRKLIFNEDGTISWDDVSSEYNK